MTTGIEFFVPGRPRPKGSWKPIVNRQTGRTMLIPDNRRSKPWEDAVRLHARAKVGTAAPWGKEVAVGIHVVFFFGRPDVHFRTRDGAPDRGSPEGLKADAAAFPIGARNYPDGDKLLRNVMDALTGVVYEDDAQVVEWWGRKEWGEEEGALITIWRIPAKT